MKAFRKRLAWPVALATGFGALGTLLYHVSRPTPAEVVLWLDLVAELPHADAYHLPDYDLDFSDPSVVRYLDERWLGIDPNTRVLESAGSAAAFRIPSVPVPMEVEIEVVPHWPPRRTADRVVVSVNGRWRSGFDAPGRTRHRFNVRPALLIEGENVFEISLPGASSFGVLRFRTGPATTQRWRHPRGSVASLEGPQPRILQQPGGFLAFSVRAPERARLAFRIPPRGTGRARYRVTAEADGEPAETLFDEVARLVGRDVELPLDRFAGRPVRLIFEVRLAGGPAAPLAWEGPRIVVQARPSPHATGIGVASPAPARPPNIVLYVIDALRADHLEPYGYTRDTSTRIAALAREAVTFENAFSNSVWTKASVGCLLTGLHPGDHGAANDVRRLDAKAKLLSSHLKAKGYTCLAFQGNGNAGSAWGFARDFDVFLEEPEIRPGRQTWDSSATIQRKLKERLQHLKEPFFLFIQSVDPHFPYEPQGEFRRYVEGDPLLRVPVRQLFERWAWRRQARSPENQRETEFLMGLYDGCIRHNDMHFGRTMDFLKEHGLYDNSAIFLTADHGEAFKEHGYEVSHSVFYQHTVRVPLILKLPGASGGPRRSSAPVQHVDIAPTILRMAGIPAKGLPGRSLLEALDPDGAASARTIHVQRYRDKELQRFQRDGWAVVSWPWKLIQENAWRPAYEIYDLEKDPLETKNLWDDAAPPSVRTRFLLAQLRRFPATLPHMETEAFTPEQRESLKALGYLQ